MENKIIKRIKCIPKDELNKIINKLQIYGINFYDNKGQLDYKSFQDNCIKTTELLFKNDKPHPKTGIRYQLCDFLSAVQTITGKRYFSRFIEGL